jgi:hypothetical protein
MVTLTALPEANSTFTGWGQSCSGASAATVITLGNIDKTCSANFETITANPTLTLHKTGTGNGVVTSADGNLNCGSQCSGNYTSGNTVTLMALPDANSNFTGWEDICTGNGSATSITISSFDASCTATFNLKPALATLLVNKTGKGTGTVTSPDNKINCGTTCSGDYASGSMVTLTALPDMASTFTGWSSNCGSNSSAATLSTLVDVSKTCTANFEPVVCTQHQVSTWPQQLEFGTEVVGSSRKIDQNVYTWSQGCGQVKVNTLQFTGNQAAEFSYQNLQCYYGGWQNYTYASCSFSVLFTPTTEGNKEAALNVVFDNAAVSSSPVPIKATAVMTGTPSLTVSPLSYDFGTVTAGNFNYYNSQRVTVKNTGNVNLKINSVAMTGPDAADFRGAQWSWCSYKGALSPNEECDVYLNFVPATVGNKQANLTITSNAPPATVVLTGTGAAPANCDDANITIESAGNANDTRWAAPTSGNYWNGYEGETAAWTRLKNTTALKRPQADDVVRIKNGHKITGIPYAMVKALCIEAGGTLESLEENSAYNYGAYLQITATDYIENKGTIRGKAGANEADNTTCTTENWWQTGGNSCTKPGAGIYLSAGLFRNEGEITAGQAGSGKQYGASGGGVSIYGTGITNTGDGLIRAGNGGNLTSTQPGQAGYGGYIGIWGSNYLTSDATRGIYSGKGGDCNFAAGQIGGNGGNMRLNAQANVNLQGPFTTGKGGTNCATNGRDGGFNTDPNVLTLSGANTKVEAGDITIYGGKDWTLNLSNLSGNVITATGDITIAVGEGGAIDMRGSTGNLLKAGGKVNIFANSILLDDNAKLSNLIDAPNIVLGPAKILRDVSLITSDSLFGEPQVTLPVTITLSNGSPETDTFLLTVSDSAGWTLSQLQPTVVKALDAVDLKLNVTLPATRGATDVITVTAVSQADPSVVATKTVQVTVAQEVSTTPPDSGTTATGGGTTATGGETTATGGGTTPTTSGGTTPTGGGTIPTDGSTTPTSAPTTTSSPVITVVNNITSCPSTGVIDSTCNNQGGVITDATVTPSANLAGGQLAGSIQNEGFISQVTIQADTTLKGGTLTGYIINQGTLADFRFVGASVKGGTLAGTITNASQVGGVFIDVTLAANTHIIGGRLQGRIKGDEKAPALLDNVRVLAGSHLSGVILGKNVVREKGVIVDKVASTETPPPSAKLPSLGKATAIDAKGNTVTTAAQFAGGVAINGQESFAAKSKAKRLSDMVDIRGLITVDPAHLGQKGELVVYLTYQLPSQEQPIKLMLDAHGNLWPWDEKVTSLVAFQPSTTLTAQQPVTIYHGVLLSAGVLTIHFGYRLPNGTLVSNSDVMEVSISQ